MLRVIISFLCKLLDGILYRTDVAYMENSL